jgi:hypothetical protein
MDARLRRGNLRMKSAGQAGLRGGGRRCVRTARKNKHNLRKIKESFAKLSSFYVVQTALSKRKAAVWARRVRVSEAFPGKSSDNQ